MSNLNNEQRARRAELMTLSASFDNEDNGYVIFSVAHPNEARELQLLNKLYALDQEWVQQDAKYDELMEVGKGAADSIREMVAALECDYDRLEELRDNREPKDDESEVDYEERQITFKESDEGKELAELELAAGECESREDAEQRILDDALEISVRSSWQLIGEALEPSEFCILLSTGGPASRIVGELRDGSPCRAWLEVQDWGTSWTEYREEGLSDVLLTYASCFYFGE